MKEEDLLFLGTIIKPRGLKGALKINCSIDSGFPKFPFEVFLLKQGQFIPFQVESLVFEPQHVIILFQEIKTVEAAQNLNGLDIYAHKAIIKTPKTAFSYRDLKGFELIDEDEGLIGTLEDILELPQQWIGVLYENGVEILIPLNEDLIVRIDKKNRRLICKLPEGLLDIYRNP